MNTIKIDFSKTVGIIKPLHGVNNAARKTDYGPLLPEFVSLRPPFSRLHDTAGVCGGGHYVDVANIFPEFGADENEESSYDFLLTDRYVLPLCEAGIEPFFRFGTTIEHEPKKYRIFPPESFEKWASVCEHVVRHYNEGWASGYRLGIRYWEIWNEPDGIAPDVEPYGPPNWLGTAEDYYRLYAVTARKIKSAHPDVFVGGYSSCYILGGFRNGHWEEGETLFFDGFLEYITAPDTRAPLDFFSWHCYLSPDNLGKLRRESGFVDGRLARYGLSGAKRFNTEWNVCICDRDVPDRRYEYYVNFRNEKGGACVLAALIEMQGCGIDAAMYYDSQLWLEYGGLFDVPSLDPTPAYHALRYFSELYEAGNECETTRPEGVYALAAAGEDRRRVFVLCNPTGKPIDVQTELVGADHTFDAFIVDSKLPERFFAKVKSGDVLTLPPFSQVIARCGIITRNP
ncbi:MAG: hypothetical protein K6C36_02485 [Clostridia bacterium]|nr:hypothetical protein [Clostridia bacterium]